MKNKTTLFKRLVKGIKQGWNAPILPTKVLNFNNNPIVRILRVIGGVSIVMVLSNTHLSLHSAFCYIILFNAFLHFVYITVISFIKLWYGLKVLKSDKLEVKNSPFDRFATTAGKILYCWKYGCQVGSAGLGLVGTSFMIDSMLEAGNQEKVFTPLIGKGVKFMVNGKPADELLSSINKDVKNLEESKKRFKEISDIFDKAGSALGSDFTEKDVNSIKSEIEKIKQMESSKIGEYAKDLSKKIKEYSEKNK